MKNVTQLNPASERDLRTELAGILETDPEVTQAAAAKQIGTSDTYISRYLRGKPTGKVQDLEQRIANWLDSYHARKAEARALPTAPGWLATPTAVRIMATLEYAQIAADVVVIYGGAGLGKTKTLRQYAQTHPQVVIATATPASAGVVPALEEVAESCGVTMTNGGARLHRAIVKKLTGSYGLLAVDEAQHLSVAALDQMRSIHDATGIGLVLIGNEKVYAGMTGGNRAPYLDRLFSRVGKKLRLLKATAADVDEIIGGWRIQARDCRKLLREIAAKPGGLGSLTKVLRLASMYAAGEEREVCCADIKAAWTELGDVA